MKFHYEIAGPEGETSKGVIEAASEREALRQLADNGQIVVRLSIQEAVLTGRVRRITREDLLLLFQELVALLSSRVSLIDSLQSLTDGHHHSGIARELEEMVAALEKGESFSSALRRCGFSLPEYMYQLAAAGEMTGKLAESLADGVRQMEYEHDIATETKNALTYPSVLVVSGLAAIGIVFAIVVPKFTNLLDNAAELPALAYLVLSTGMFVNHYSWEILTVLLLVALALFFLLRQASVRQSITDALVRWPFIGSWLIESEAGRWTGLLGTLLGNGVTLIDALELCNRGVRLTTYRARFGQVVRSVRAGLPLSGALQEQQALTAMSYHIIKVGEGTGRLPEMLLSVSGLYANSGKNRMRRALTLIEPLAILVIGGVIGVVILGIMLAITSAADVPL